jgi:hypothetical protein
VSSGCSAASTTAAVQDALCGSMPGLVEVDEAAAFGVGGVELAVQAGHIVRAYVNRTDLLGPRHPQVVTIAPRACPCCSSAPAALSTHSASNFTRSFNTKSGDM